MAQGALLKTLWLKNSAYASPARVLHHGHQACTHLAHLSVDGRLQTAYIKAFPIGFGKCLFNEAVGSAMARRAGFGAPDGGLIGVDARLLENLFPTFRFPTQDREAVCWASLPVLTGYGLAEVGVLDTVGPVLALIRQYVLAWDGFAACAAFDAWVGNIDRHANNLLVAGGGRLVPIDHSECFGGGHWEPDEFERPQTWYLNKLLDLICAPAETLALPAKAGLMAAAEQFAVFFRHYEADLAAVAPWLGPHWGPVWLKWLQQRSLLVVDLVRDRVRMLV